MQTLDTAQRCTTPLGAFIDLAALHQIEAVRSTFPSEQSLRWFVRQHREELACEGALICLTGRLKFNAERFQQAAVSIGMRSALPGQTR
jgi:hypothetical protein